MGILKDNMNMRNSIVNHQVLRVRRSNHDGKGGVIGNVIYVILHVTLYDVRGYHVQYMIHIIYIYIHIVHME